jgi:1,2-diacylglycerol 3-beta-glucosyltransferase
MSRRTLGTLARTGAAGGAVVAAVPGTYLGALTALSGSRRCATPSTELNIAIVVPAHNERDGIAATVTSLASLDYPHSKRQIIVVADNCTDDTAAVASTAGATVWERTDANLRGKGHALRWAFDRLLADGWADAVVVVDADTLVDGSFLQHVAGHLVAGSLVVQADYRVRNPEASWRTRLVDVAFTANHLIRSSGRARLGVSAGLRGNGMAFSCQALEKVPYDAFSAVEDLEYGIHLGQAGVRVDFCDATFVGGDMPSNADGAHSQRVRWELGRASIRRQHGASLARTAVRRRDPLLADLAVDLYVPPLATVAALLGAGTAVTAGARRFVGRTPVAVMLAGCVGLAAHATVAVVRSPSGWRALPAMARVPWYAAWKVSVRLSKSWRTQQRQGVAWTRTQRSDTVGDGRADEQNHAKDVD